MCCEFFLFDTWRLFSGYLQLCMGSTTLCFDALPVVYGSAIDFFRSLAKCGMLL